jgi:predicted AlkP superfamily phosphohydrolase/phosphomutase
MGNFGQLYVNLKGREQKGAVAPGAEYESLLDDLTQRLHALVDPETNQPVIERVLRRDQVYAGPYADRAPDLLFFTDKMEYKPMGLSDFSSPHVFDPVYGTTGHHRMNGVLICYGPGFVREGVTLEGARIHDLAPTILYMMGQPIPSVMDGQVLQDLFTPEYREQNEVTYSQSDDSTTDKDGDVYSKEEEAEMMELLRALGYVT